MRLLCSRIERLSRDVSAPNVPEATGTRKVLLVKHRFLTFNPSVHVSGERLPPAGGPPPWRDVASLTISWSLQLVQD